MAVLSPAGVTRYVLLSAPAVRSSGGGGEVVVIQEQQEADEEA